MAKKDLIESLKEDLRAREIGGSHNFNSVGISNSNLNYVQMGMTPSDLKLIENQVNKKRDIASVYGFDSALFNDPDKSTFNNRKEAELSAFTSVYIPLAEKVDMAKVMYFRRVFNENVEINILKDEIEIFQREEIEEEPQNNNPNEEDI